MIFRFKIAHAGRELNEPAFHRNSNRGTRLFYRRRVFEKLLMLIINECRTCNAEKATCPIKAELQKKLTGIKERLRYKCKGWQRHLEYKIGDKITFHFIEKGEHGGELSGETLTGRIIDVSKKKPVHMVVIDAENRKLIDKEFSAYDRFVTPCGENGEFVYPEEESNFFHVPVKEELITGIAE